MGTANETMPNVEVVDVTGLVVVNDCGFARLRYLEVDLLFADIGFKVVFAVVFVISFCNYL
jgi:hypothetical protein